MKKIVLSVKILAVLAVVAQLTACLSNEDPYRAGFQFTKPVNVRTSIFANTTLDSLVMVCYGPWQITSDTPAADWVTIDEMKGRGNAVYSLGVHFEPNTTGTPRLAQFTITDTDHPGDGHSTWQYLQYATRGDGSLGSAALVKSITSSDGWNVDISYDFRNRPAQLTVKGPENVNEQYRMDYDEKLSTLTVNTGTGSLKGTMDAGYQSERLIGGGDTIGYTQQYYSNGMSMSVNNAFNYVASRLRRTQAYAYLLGGKSLDPDSLHTADSLVYYSKWKLVKKPTIVERFKMEYGQMDNRCQSVDVNQLILGMDDCEPLQLISMFRYCRSTSIVKRAISADRTIDVTTELNANRSVRRMVVRDSSKDAEVTYDFTY